MATEAQINANRLNAAKSTGPKTPDGKDVVSKNALKHGLTSANDCLRSEDVPEFESFRDSFISDLKPQGPVEEMLANRFVSISWRLNRLRLIQNQSFDYLNQNDIYNNSLANIGLPFIFKKQQLADPDHDPTLPLGRLAVKDFSNGRVLERLLMYERRLEHSLFKILSELKRLQILRKFGDSADLENINYAKQSQF